MLKRWKRLTSSVVSTNPWWTYRKDTFKIPGGVSGEYHYVYTPGSSMIVPVDADGMVWMVNQYRYLCDRESLEFPCGSVKEGHTFVDTARFELEEETGLGADALEEAGHFNPYNGVTSEICRVFLATGLAPGTPRPDETEEFELLRMRPDEVEDHIERNEIWDGMTLAAWTLVRRRFPSIV